MNPQRFTEIFSKMFPKTQPEANALGQTFWFEPYLPDARQLWWSDEEILVVASEVLRESQSQQ